MCVSTFGSRRHRLAVPLRVVCVSVIVIVALVETSNAQESALVFDGIDDLATITSPIGWPSGTSALTVEAWVKPADVSGTSMKGIVVADGHFVMVQQFSDNSRLGWSISNGPTDAAVTPTGSLVAGRWDHFAGTYDGTTMRIYQNGELVAENAHPAGGPVGIGGDLFVGFWPGASGFAGVIGEVRIWNAVRTEAEVESWMSRPLTGSEPDLLGYWRLNEGSGQVITDATSFGNGGVLGSTTAVEPEDPQWTDPVPYLAFFFDGFESGDISKWSAMSCGNDPAPPAGLCPPECTGGCLSNVCIVDCSLTSSCEMADIVCPPNFTCEVECSGDSSCSMASIYCPANYSCSLSCTSANSCSMTTINCPVSAPCEVLCAGPSNSCSATEQLCGLGNCEAVCTAGQDVITDCGNACSCVGCP